MGWWTAFKKWRALRSYLRAAAPALVRRYGFQEAFSPEQVLATLSAERLDTDHAQYACAAFCTESDFVTWTAEPHESHARARELYRALRDELVEDYNGGHQLRFRPPAKDFEQVGPLRTSYSTRNPGFRWYR
jgi:hypothetical protein